eukprot:2338265-Rhodomonas_salina.1
MAVDTDVLAERLLQKFVKSRLGLHVSDGADEVFPLGHFLHSLHHRNEKEVVGVGLLEVDEFFSKKNDQLTEGLPLAIEGLEQQVECLSALVHCLVIAQVIPMINQLVELRSAVWCFFVVRRALRA